MAQRRLPAEGTLQHAQQQIGDAIRLLHPNSVFDRYSEVLYVDCMVPGSYEAVLSIAVQIELDPSGARVLQLSHPARNEPRFSSERRLCTTQEWVDDPERYSRRALAWALEWLEQIA